MASQPGRPFSRNELMDTARGEDANALADFSAAVQAVETLDECIGRIVETYARR